MAPQLRGGALLPPPRRREPFGLKQAGERPFHLAGLRCEPLGPPVHFHFLHCVLMGSSSRPVLAQADLSDDGDALHNDEFLLSNWFVTDLSLDVMNRHNGGAVSELQQRGATVCEADLLKLSVHPIFHAR